MTATSLAQLERETLARAERIGAVYPLGWYLRREWDTSTTYIKGPSIVDARTVEIIGWWDGDSDCPSDDAVKAIIARLNERCFARELVAAE